MTRFHSYAGRVRHITHRQSVQVHPDLLSFLSNSFTQCSFILPSLRSAQISSSIHNAFQASLSLSPELCHVQLDLGFKARDSSRLSDDILLHYLKQVIRFSPNLDTISIRGSATQCLNVAISLLQNVKVLSLCLGSSLATDTLLAVTSFPCLLEFEVHAAHFDVEELGRLFLDRKASMFPSLQKLHVRAHSPVIELFLRALPDDSLHSLHIEVEDPTGTTVSWITIFNLICTKSANTLRKLTIEHNTELDGLDLEINNSTYPHPIADDKFNIHIPFTDLQVFEGLLHLRRFVLDTTLPVDIDDHKLELMLGWWPELEHLDLGSLPPVNPRARQPLSSHSLVVIAKKSTKLINLVLPVDISWAHNTPMVNLPRQPMLMRLTCGHPFPRTHTDVEVAKYLHWLFPSLRTLDGLSDQEDQWSRTQTVLRCLADHRCDEF